MGKLASIKFMKRAHMDRVLDIDYMSHKHMADKRGDKSLIKRRWLLKQYERFLSRKGTRGYVMEEGEDNVIGFLLVDFSNTDEFHITRLVIDPNYRRSGFGSELFRTAVLLNGKKSMCSRFVVMAYEEDLELQQFMSKKGFSCRLVKNQFGPGRDGISFVRPQKDLNTDFERQEQTQEQTDC